VSVSATTRRRPARKWSNSEIAGDAVEPSRRVAVVRGGNGTSSCPQEDLLRQITGDLTVAYGTAQILEQPPGVRSDSAARS
jgi:hypothetical protein